MNGLRPASYLPASGRLQQDYSEHLDEHLLPLISRNT
jgi:hypothetical protein